jgi:DNA-binding SARP family transcriptional activator
MDPSMPEVLALDVGLSLRTLGRVALLRASSAGADATPIPLGPKQFALLTYLACAPDRSATRVRLYSLFAHRTGDGDTESAHRDAVRQLMLEVRTRLGRDALGPPRVDPVRLTIPLTCDRDELLAAWERHDFPQVVQLYHGDFLPNFEQIGSTEFSHWVEQERADLRRRFGVAARDSIQAALATEGSPAVVRHALDTARRLQAYEPLAQDAWQLVLRCLVALGEHEEAALEGRRLREHLTEQELTADARTRELLALIDAAPRSEAPRGRLGDTSGPVEPARNTRISGRETELSIVGLSWDRARTGTLVHVHLTAPAGLGKSALLADARQRLRGRAGAKRRVRTVQACAHYASRDEAFSLVTQLVSALARTPGGLGVPESVTSTLVTLDASLRDQYQSAPLATLASHAPARSTVVGALTELIGAVALEGPVAVFLDDMHWADTQSMEVLAEALSSCAGLPVLVVSAARNPCAALCAATNARQLMLAPLDAAAIGEMLAHRARLPAEPWAQELPLALANATGGSPLHVNETLQLLAERALLRPTRDGWTTDDPAGLLSALGEGDATLRRVAQLSAEERTLLLLLAVAGAPLTSGELRTAAALPLANFNAALAALERRGFALRQGQGWSVAHDEYSRVAVQVGTESQIRTARLALGAALAEAVGDDPAALRRAGRLLAPAGVNPLLTSVFGRFVRSARNRRDPRSDRELAQDFLGDAEEHADAAGRLRSDLPLHLRLRLVTPARMWQAASAFVLVVAVAAFAASRAMNFPAPAKAALLAIRPSPDHSLLEAFEVSLPPDRWPGSGGLDIDLTRRPTHRIPAGGVGGRALKPDGTGWTVGIPVPDSGIIDLFDVSLDGRARRLTHAAGDDYQPSWAPDNSALVFVTSRWSTRGRYDLAILEAGSGRVRRLTSGDDIDWEPSWSPDGSRIAFIRQYAGSGAQGLCVVDADGSHLDYREADSASTPALAGWLDAHRVLLRHATGTTTRLTSYHLSERTTAVIDNRAAGAVISPDGRFAVCQCGRDGYAADTWIVYPLARPNDFVVLHTDPSRPTPTSFAWAPDAARPPFVSTLTIGIGNGPPQLRAKHQLRVIAVDSSGAAVAPGVVRWTSTDTTVAIIDSTGMLRARRPGRVTIAASAGGWRQARRELSVAGAPARTVFAEGWSTALDSTWRTFGIPRPRIVRHDALGNAFLNNGDASFFSGAYTRRAFPLRDGLWVETVISTPLTAEQSQSLVVSLFSVGSASARAAWSAWDHLSGDGPPGLATPSCSVRYPDGAGGARIGDELRITTTGASGLFAAPKSMRTGAPHTLVMQLLPDGRCGVAVDDQTVWVGPATFLQSDVKLMLAGNSVDSPMLVGRVRVGTGIARAFADR